MRTCTNCGEQNPDDQSRCRKCGVGLGYQSRAKTDASRSKVASGVKTIWTIAVLVVLALVALPAYHAACGVYFTYRLNSAKEGATSECKGPVTASMQQYQKDQINQCMAADETYAKAQAAYDAFKNPGKS